MNTRSGRGAREIVGTAPADEVADRLHSAAIHLLRRLRREDVAWGLPGAQLSALSVVVFAGPMKLGDLAAAEQVRPATMSRLVDALTKRGLVVRDADQTDRRKVRVRATESGHRMLAEGRSRRIGALAKQLEALDDEDLAILARASQLLDELLHRHQR
jgi:DNA-binding MarR family transcriptional regulator